MQLQETVQEWHRPEKSYKLLEITIKILKVSCYISILSMSIYPVQ